MKQPTTILPYGETGTGKTVQIGRIAEWVRRRFGKVSRLVTADSGADPIQALIDDSTMEILDLKNLHDKDEPFALLMKLSEGAWPIVTPEGRLSMSRSPKRGEPIVRADGKQVGLIAFEGLSTISEVLLMDHAKKGRKLSQDLAYTFSETVLVDGKPENVVVGKAAQAHYGNVQEFVVWTLVPRTSVLPVDIVVWTAHEARGEEDGGAGLSKSVLGPATVGKAMVGGTGKKFMDTLHLTKERKGTELLYKAWYEDHPDEALKTSMWRAKLSLPLEKNEQLHKMFPGGFIPLSSQGGLERYLDLKFGK